MLSRQAVFVRCCLRKYPDIGELLNELQDVQSKAASIAEYEMFVCGFRTGAQLMLEMLRD